MPSNRKRAAIAAIPAVVLLLAGCGQYGETHNNNAPAPTGDQALYWHRISTPGNYSGVIMACDGPDGIYVGQSDGQLWVVASDPNCKGVNDVVPDNGGLPTVPSGQANPNG